MKYATALIPLFLFTLLDVLIIASMLILIGLIIILEKNEFPYSFTFAKRIWT